jgi:hypothetical protein
MATNHVALRSIPISLQVEDVNIRGEVVCLLPNELVVEITYPVGGRWLPLHLPHFAMARQNWYATVDGWQTTGLSQKGVRRAVELLMDLYEMNKEDVPFAPPVAQAYAYYSLRRAEPSNQPRQPDT